MSELQATLERLQEAGHRVELDAELTGGQTNRTWAVRIDGERAALRIRREAPGERLSVATEVAVMQAVETLAPDVLYADEVALVTRFVDHVGPPPVEALGRALARLHLTEVRGLRGFDLAGWLRTAVWPEGMEAEADRAHRIAGHLGSSRPSVCHHDLSPENIRYDGTVRLLDWEYACLGDPAVDLVGATRGLPETERDQLLRAYAVHGGLGRWSPAAVEAVALLEAHWYAARLERLVNQRMWRP